MTWANGHATHNPSGATSSRTNPAIRATDVSRISGGPRSTPTGETRFCHERMSGAFTMPRIRLIANPTHTARTIARRNFSGSVRLSSRLVEGRFPNYQQLLPESFEHELRVSTGELIEVVRRISLLAQKNAPLRLRFSDGTLDVSAQTPDIGEASESLPVPFKGEALEIGFNPEFLREGLESAEADEVTLKLISPLRPGLIEAADDGAGSFLYLVMPIRLNV